MDKSASKNIAAILGPALMVVVAAEFPLVQPGLYVEQTPPVVFLSGVLLFVAGLTIVRKHNVWARDWTVLVTLCGWAMLGLGLTRLFTATAYHQVSLSTPSWIFIVIEGALILVGLFLTFKAYGRSS